MRVSGAPVVRRLDRIAPDPHTAHARAQRFPAYVAHELRGEIAVVRTLAEVALADPDADASTLREMGECIVVACERQERLLTALLTLARSTCGSLLREPVELASTAAGVLSARECHGLSTTTTLEPAPTTGDPQLLECLVANLIANAVHHNLPGGRFDIVTYRDAGRAVFAIENTGPVIPAAELSRLFQPFQRLGPSADGAGLGLAIVQAIAGAHDATVTARALRGGGLGIAVAFPVLD
jgi:signal transduction histidine kinase